MEGGGTRLGDAQTVGAGRVGPFPAGEQPAGIGGERLDPGIGLGSSNQHGGALFYAGGWPGEVGIAPDAVLALEGPEAYSFKMPVFKDLGSPGMLYCRSYGGNQMLVSEGTVGETLAQPDNEQGDISMDYVVEVGGQVAERFPSFGEAGLASSWTGVYDVTPDWNPVLGRLPDVPGLIVGYGFSGHGFKLSPGVGLVLAQEALGLPTDVSLAPYAHERFRSGNLLTGRYGLGAVS